MGHLVPEPFRTWGLSGHSPRRAVEVQPCVIGQNPVTFPSCTAGDVGHVEVYVAPWRAPASAAIGGPEGKAGGPGALRNVEPMEEPPREGALWTAGWAPCLGLAGWWSRYLLVHVSRALGHVSESLF